jgi:hypothetical protein
MRQMQSGWGSPASYNISPNLPGEHAEQGIVVKDEDSRFRRDWFRLSPGMMLKVPWRLSA